MTDAIEKKTIQVNGAEVVYHEKGEGEVVLLLHGGGPGAAGLSNYVKNIDALSQQFRVIVPDAPGYGESEYVLGEGSIFTALANVTLGLMDALTIDKAHLVGNSMGGATALRLALIAPERIRRMVLMGPAGSKPAHSLWPTEGILKIGGFYRGDGPSLEKLREVIEYMVYDASSITDDLLTQRLKNSLRPEVVANPHANRLGVHPEDNIWLAQLDALEHETLLVWGREDRVVPLDAYVPLLNRMPNAHLHVFPNCGHWAQWEKADEFNALVTAFITTS